MDKGRFQVKRSRPLSDFPVYKRTPKDRQRLVKTERRFRQVAKKIVAEEVNG